MVFSVVFGRPVENTMELSHGILGCFRNTRMLKAEKKQTVNNQDSKLTID
jgi:nitrogenase molybdenum-iron protein alpha/beta subunit